MSRRLSPSRAAALALAVSAACLFALTFAPWFAHEGLHGPEADRLRGDESLILALSGWELDFQIAAVVLLAVLIGLLASLRVAHPVVFALAAGAGLLAAWRIAHELRSPSDTIYNDPRTGIYLALVAALALAMTGALAFVLSVAGRRVDAVAGQATPAWPLMAGAAALYALALFANESEIWTPQFIGACCLATVVGYLIPRWWLAALPIPAVIVLLQVFPDSCDPRVSDCSEAGLRDILFAFMAITVSVALALGIATRWLERRTGVQQHV